MGNLQIPKAMKIVAMATMGLGVLYDRPFTSRMLLDCADTVSSVTVATIIRFEYLVQIADTKDPPCTYPLVYDPSDSRYGII